MLIRELTVSAFAVQTSAQTTTANKKDEQFLVRLFLLSHEDSNLDRQNQKLQCYHYTIRQSSQPRLIVLIAVQS